VRVTSGLRISCRAVYVSMAATLVAGPHSGWCDGRLYIQVSHGIIKAEVRVEPLLCMSVVNI
jgi:hypothetical protein